MASPSTQHAVDIDELSTSTKEKLQRLPPLSNECCIYSAPHGMRSSSKRYFTPQIVSVGPMHYRNKKLRENKHLKERYLADFCELTQVSLKKCYKHILEHERRVRNCYADFIGLNSENFVEMILVDAAFLLMILVYYYFPPLQKEIDLVFTNAGMITDIVPDLLLLENQLPFFILDDLYKLSKLHNILDRKFKLTFGEETAMNFFAHNFLQNLDSPKVQKQHPPSKPKHILDLLESCLIPTEWNPQRRESKVKNMPSAKKLHQAGVKIQVSCNDNMFDIKFSDGKLEIPPLSIFDSSQQLFRNLLAYEICHPPTTHIFSDYFEMLRLLTLSSEDTELLVQNEIIINGLSSAEQISTLFQKIDTGNVVDPSKFLYADVIDGLNEYYNNEWHKWKETLKEKYFKAPWAICSVSLAVLLLVLTIVQTVFTILQVVLPK